jgi:carboxyl-terminal processing protease
LKITTNEYFTPKRNSINKIGIKPDIEVDLSDKAKESINLKDEDDNQLQKAIEVIKSK